MYPDSKVHGANMGPICGRQDPGGPHVGTMNVAIWVITSQSFSNVGTTLVMITRGKYDAHNHSMLIRWHWPDKHHNDTTLRPDHPPSHPFLPQRYDSDSDTKVAWPKIMGCHPVTSNVPSSFKWPSFYRRVSLGRFKWDWLSQFCRAKKL